VSAQIVLDKEANKYFNLSRHKVILHKIELSTILENIDKKDVELIIEALKLNVKEHKQTSGDYYTVESYKEERGETLTIYKDKKTSKHKILLITHRIERAETFREYMKILGKTLGRILIELYIRYHEKDERKVEVGLEAILRQYGKTQHIINHMHNGRKIAYLNRVMKVEYQGAEISIKTYRHKHYSRYSPSNPEYHPKLEQTTIIHNMKEPIKEAIEKYAVFINTIVKTLRLTQLYSQYDTQQETIAPQRIDPSIERIVKGVRKRVKAIHILEREYHDIKEAIAIMITIKKMKQTQIARLLGYSRDYVKKIVKELETQGIIKRIARGKYTLTRPLVVERLEHKYNRTIADLIREITERKAKLCEFPPGAVRITPSYEYIKEESTEVIEKVRVVYPYLLLDRHEYQIVAKAIET